VEQELLHLPEHLRSTPGFSGVRVTRSLVLCVCFVDRCSSFRTFFFWPLCCLFLFDIRILITPFCIFKLSLIQIRTIGFMNTNTKSVFKCPGVLKHLSKCWQFFVIKSDMHKIKIPLISTKWKTGVCTGQVSCDVYWPAGVFCWFIWTGQLIRDDVWLVGVNPLAWQLALDDAWPTGDNWSLICVGVWSVCPTAVGPKAKVNRGGVFWIIHSRIIWTWWTRGYMVSWKTKTNVLDPPVYHKNTDQIVHIQVGS